MKPLLHPYQRGMIRFVAPGALPDALAEHGVPRSSIPSDYGGTGPPFADLPVFPECLAESKEPPAAQSGISRTESAYSLCSTTTSTDESMASFKSCDSLSRADAGSSAVSRAKVSRDDCCVAS